LAGGESDRDHQGFEVAIEACGDAPARVFETAGHVLDDVAHRSLLATDFGLFNRRTDFDRGREFTNA
jgi:hypothetical protein